MTQSKPQDAVDRANELVEVRWVWTVYTATHRNLVVSALREPCDAVAYFVFRRPTYVRLPQCMEGARFRLGPAENPPGEPDAAPSGEGRVDVRIDVEGREFGVVCSQVALFLRRANDEIILA